MFCPIWFLDQHTAITIHFMTIYCSNWISKKKRKTHWICVWDLVLLQIAYKLSDSSFVARSTRFSLMQLIGTKSPENWVMLFALHFEVIGFQSLKWRNACQLCNVFVFQRVCNSRKKMKAFAYPHNLTSLNQYYMF